MPDPTEAALRAAREWFDAPASDDWEEDTILLAHALDAHAAEAVRKALEDAAGEMSRAAATAESDQDYGAQDCYMDAASRLRSRAKERE